MNRVVCHFSCGAASAVATKLTLTEYDPERVVILNALIAEEHPDNRRFLADCERWFSHPITVVWGQKWGYSAREVWRRVGYMKGPFGASCSGRLKREVIAAYCKDDDINVLGFTVEERDRAQRFLDTGARCPLIERGLTKADCLAIIQRAGIEIPEMYRLGYNNANCMARTTSASHGTNGRALDIDPRGWVEAEAAALPFPYSNLAQPGSARKSLMARGAARGASGHHPMRRGGGSQEFTGWPRRPCDSRLHTDTGFQTRYRL